MRQAVVYIFFVLMVLVTFLFVTLNIVFWEWLSINLSIRFFIDIVFAVVTVFFLPSILILDADIDIWYALLGVIASLMLTVGFVILYAVHLDTQLLLLMCKAYNIVLFLIFLIIHIVSKHPITVEYQELVDEANERQQSNQGMFERLRLASGMTMLEGSSGVIGDSSSKQSKATTIDGFELKTIDNFSFETIDIEEEEIK